MIPTPRTAAEHDNPKHSIPRPGWVRVEFAEELERELKQVEQDHQQANNTLRQADEKIFELLSHSKQFHEKAMELSGQLTAAMRLIADIRAAVGDPKGKLMPDRLLDRCRELAARPSH
jgi:chromosome segregation ATPase